MKYRLYIDESGTHNYSVSEDMDKRFLSLTGIMLDETSNSTVLQPRMTQIKRIFSDDPDEPPVLHREEIVKKSGAFALLKDPIVEAEFNRQLTELLQNLNFHVCGVVIDKKAHLAKYGASAEHPYHYCLSILLERYTYFLTTHGGRGDVVAESRGGPSDMALKQAYRDFYDRGTAFRSAAYVQSALTSKEIKIKNKSAGYIGLELADVLTMPTKIDVLNIYGVIPNLSKNFNKTLVDLIQVKYCKGVNGKIKGYGKKLI